MFGQVGVPLQIRRQPLCNCNFWSKTIGHTVRDRRCGNFLKFCVAAAATFVRKNSEGRLARHLQKQCPFWPSSFVPVQVEWETTCQILSRLVYAVIRVLVLEHRPECPALGFQAHCGLPRTPGNVLSKYFIQSETFTQCVQRKFLSISCLIA